MISNRLYFLKSCTFLNGDMSLDSSVSVVVRQSEIWLSGVFSRIELDRPVGGMRPLRSCHTLIRRHAALRASITAPSSSQDNKVRDFIQTERNIDWTHIPLFNLNAVLHNRVKLQLAIIEMLLFLCLGHTSITIHWKVLLSLISETLKTCEVFIW